MKGDDAFGRALLDWVEDPGGGQIVVERDDGFVFTDTVAYYGSPIRRWEPQERHALRLARGRVLDAGCGLARVALELERRGRDVTAVDVSPLAIEAARRRGARDARVASLEEIDGSDGAFDTVVLYGNNLGLLGSPASARRILRRLHAATTPRGRILGACMDIGSSDDPDHRAYFDRNTRRGRLPGQVRLRVRYRRLVGAWFDWLFLATAELEDLLDGTGWRLARVIEGRPGRYVAVIEKR